VACISRSASEIPPAASERKATIIWIMPWIVFDLHASRRFATCRDQSRAQVEPKSCAFVDV
jgi:hypothetical protein